MNPKFTLRSLKLFVIVMLLSFCTISQVQSQSVNIADYGAEYTGKPGDSMEYTYTTVNVPSINYYNQSIYLQNGSYENVKVTQGTLLAVTITDVSASPYTNILVNEKFSTPKGETYHFDNVTSNYIIPSFDNQSILNSFLDALNNQSNDPNHPYTCDNTFLYLHSSSSGPIFSSNGQNVNLTTTLDIVANWHTGWLKSQDMVSRYSNGTLLSSVKFEQVTNNPVDQVINTGMNLAVFLIPIMVIAIIGFAFISYKKRNLSNANNANKNSFSHYLATNFKKQKQKPQTKKIQIDKSLEIIDDILKETENR